MLPTDKRDRQSDRPELRAEDARNRLFGVGRERAMRVRIVEVDEPELGKDLCALFGLDPMTAFRIVLTPGNVWAWRYLLNGNGQKYMDGDHPSYTLDHAVIAALGGDR